MNYLKEYGITEDEIAILEDIYNENIINFIVENKFFIIEKLEFLKSERYNLFEILKNNIKIFLEITPTLLRKIDRMKIKQYNKKQIENILTNEILYTKI